MRQARPLAVALLALAGASAQGCAGAADEGSAGSGTSTGAATAAPADVRARQRALHEQVTAALKQHAADQSYGGVPGYLPKATHRTERVLHARAGHPVLTIQGDTVDLQVAGGRARTVLVGPAVPAAVAGTNAEVTPASWSLTLSQVRGRVPVQASRFRFVDQHGVVHHLRLALHGGGRAPAAARAGGAGGSLSLTLSGRVPSGSGRLFYRSPGGEDLVGWDFTVETD